MSKPIQTVEELDAVLHWRGKHAQAIRERDALQALLTSADERVDGAVNLLEIWRTWLGPTRESCDETGKKIWDRIDAVTAPKPVEGSTCNQIREESGLPTNHPCQACGHGSCIDR